MTIDKTTGLIAAAPTGFHENGDVDYTVIPPLLKHLDRQGVAGIFINGTTGEGMSLSTEEREQQSYAWRQLCPQHLKMFVHVGHNSLAEARRLAAHAQQIEADAVAAIAPSFFKPEGVTELVEWCAKVAEAAPELPFYFYHMPGITGVQPRIADFLEKAAPRIPNLGGIKFTFEAMDDFIESLRFDNKRYDVLWGRDEMLLGALAVGAEGAVGSTPNIATPLYNQMIQAFNQGDMERARTLQAQSVALIRQLAGSGNLFSALKAVLRAQGVPISLFTRSPLVPLPDKQAEELADRCLEIINS